MKIIFLDIDGVLNSGRSFLAFAHRIKELDNSDYPAAGYIERMTRATIDPIAVGLVNKVLRDFDAKIVLSSSHRLRFLKDNGDLTNARAYLAKLGLDSDRLIGLTDSLHTARGTEIADWLRRHRQQVESYIILDDAADMLGEQQEFFIRTDPAIGISEDNYRTMTRLFGREDSGLVLL